MAELKEVFEMVTNKVEPDVEAWREQEDRQRQAERRRRVGALLVAAAIAVAATAVGFAATHDLQGSEPEPAHPAPVEPGIYVVDVGTGEVAPQVHLPADAEAVTWSPDGSRAAFTLIDGGHPQIFLTDPEGGTTQLTSDHMRGCECGAEDPAWSPDGLRIAFSGFSGERGIHIYTIDVASGRVQQVSDLPRVGLVAAASQPAWSPDGSTIAFVAGEYSDVRIWTVRISDGRQREVTKATAGASPTWSPDGRWIAFTGGDDPQAGTDIWLVHPDGSNPHVVADVARFDEDPTWSPDGSTIAFGGFRADADPPTIDLATVDVSTGKVRILGTDMREPAWITPAGRSITVARG